MTARRRPAPNPPGNPVQAPRYVGTAPARRPAGGAGRGTGSPTWPRGATARRRRVLLLWVVALVAVTVVAGSIGGEHHADYAMPGSQSAAVRDLLAERFPEQAGDAVYLVAHVPGRHVRSPTRPPTPGSRR